MSSFKGRVAVVTGGASGIGRALGQALEGRGAVVILADVDEAALREATGSFAAAETATVDVRDAAAVEKLVAATVARHGRLDYLFNNAGIGIFGEERDVDLDDWRRVIDVDLWGVVNGVRAAYPRFVAQGSGHIVNTASLAGLVAIPLEASYTAAKHAVVGLSLALRAEGAGLGVRVSVVCPGLIETPILRTSQIRGMDREKCMALVASARALSVESCAAGILRGVERNRAVIVVPGGAKLAWLLSRISPRAAVWFWERVFLRRFRALRTPDAHPNRGAAPDPG